MKTQFIRVSFFLLLTASLASCRKETTTVSSDGTTQTTEQGYSEDQDVLAPGSNVEGTPADSAGNQQDRMGAESTPQEVPGAQTQE